MPTTKQGTIATYAIIAGLLLLLAYPALAWLVRSWWVNPYYSHGFLIPPLAAILAWGQWEQVRHAPQRGATWPGLGLAGLSLAAVVWAMRWQYYALAALATIALVAGIFLYLEGWARLKPWLFPLLFLALMVPLPIVDLLAPRLESFTAHWAAGLARLAGIPVVQQGGEIGLPGTTIVVGAPCSGLRSLVVMVTLGVGWIYLVEGRLLSRLLLLAAIVPLVVLSNVARVAGLLIVAVTLGEEAALSYYHDWSGVVLFLVAVGLMLGLGKAFGCARLRNDLW